jgi:hypothetical protein
MPESLSTGACMQTSTTTLNVEHLYLLLSVRQELKKPGTLEANRGLWWTPLAT